MDKKICLSLFCLLVITLAEGVSLRPRVIKTVDLLAKIEQKHDAASCNPHPSPNASHFIIGYGSLMETASKERTFKNTGENIPVEIQGYSRQWNLKGDGIGPDTTYLGVIEDASSKLNGVIFQLSQSIDIVEALKTYDEREHFYCRHKVDPSDISVLGGGPPTVINGQYWIYVNKPQFLDSPTKDYPIVQSYVDVFMSGCLELEEKFKLTDFAKSCVTTTKGWDGQFWVNDRIYPRRPFVYQKKAAKIDKVLEDNLAEEFSKIQIEG